MPDAREHGFLFKAEMIRAMLSGLKWQTRRVCTAHNSLIDGSGYGIRKHWKRLQWDRAWVDHGPSPAGNPGQYWKVPCTCMGTDRGMEVVHRVYPRVQEGDAIWAKETWTTWEDYESERSSAVIRYRADGMWYSDAGKVMDQLAMPDNDPQKWRSAMLMPRVVARIVRPVTGVRAARVGDIDNNDALAEGTPDLRTPENNWDMRDCFGALWNSINGNRPGMSFEADPPCWVFEWEPMA